MRLFLFLGEHPGNNIGRQLSSKTEVDEQYFSIRIDQNIFWFEIVVNDIAGMDQ